MRVTTEDCLSIDVPSLLRKGLLRWGKATPPTILDGRAPDGKKYSIMFSADTRGERPWVRLRFIDCRGKTVTQTIPMVVTHPHFGGACPWFFACGVRSRRLFLPPQQDAFLPRRAWIGLTYRSRCLGRRGRAKLRLEKFQRKHGLYVEIIKPPRMWPRTWDALKGQQEHLKERARSRRLEHA
jgi:hypothetical protein